MPYDQYHETACNLNLKQAINNNQVNPEVFESIGFWLPIRAKFLEELKKFVFNNKTEKTEDDRYINAQETRRHNEKITLALNFFKERLNINPIHLDSEDFKEELTSLNGDKLIGNKSLLLNNRVIGTAEMKKFVDERLLSHEKSPFDNIKRMNIPVFNYMDHKTKKKKNKPVSERTELKATAKILKILDDRPFIGAGDLGRYQISQYHALTDPCQKDVKPNIKSGKAKSLSNYIVKVSPDSVSRTRPTFSKGSTLTVIEGENIIALGPACDTTLGEHIDNLFQYYVFPYFASSKLVCLMFDDKEGKNLKMTNEKRYNNDNKSSFNLTMMTVVNKDCWANIFKNPANKLLFKQLFITRVKEKLRHEFEPSHTLYLNGAFDDGKVYVVTKNNIHENSKVLPIGESDIKIFKFIENSFDMDVSNFLVISMDTDVKMISIVFQATHQRINVVVKSSNQVLPYFIPQAYIKYVEENFSNDSSPQVHAENMLQVYILFGVDQNPGFYGICHSAGLFVFDVMSRQRALSTQDDFLELILETYKNKNTGVKRFMQAGKSHSIIEKHILTREIVKCFKGIEANTVPILSVLNLHLKRSKFLVKSWIYPNEVLNEDPCKHGFRKNEDGTFLISLQDNADPFFSLPQSLLKGCSCKGRGGQADTFQASDWPALTFPVISLVVAVSSPTLT